MRRTKWSQRSGITLTSLVIYVIGLTILFATIANLTIYFNKNSRSIEFTTNNSAQLTRLNQYLISDTKSKNIKSVNVENNIIQINVDNEEIKYIYDSESKGIYRNKVKISNDVQLAKFSKETVYDKSKITIEIVIGEQEKVSKTLEFII